MKTHRGLYEKICSLENLYIAFRKSKKGKSRKWYVKKFEANLHDEITKLHEELSNQTYEPQKLKRFIIRDPKTRVIHASHFRDRVVHHAFCNVVEPIFDKTFIHDYYASRKGKGTHAALRRFQTFQRKVSQNGRIVSGGGVRQDNNFVIGYVLKADIKHYFQSVDHGILIGMIERKIDDERVIWLLRKILGHNSTNKPKGMPIGNLTSQFFANLYLNELDYFVKHILHARYYIRYVDDFVILDRSRAILHGYREKIGEFLKDRLSLELHEQKSQVYPLHKGISFLGFRMFYHYKLPKRNNLGKFDRRMQRLKELHDAKDISSERVSESLDGWLAYAEHGNTYKLRKRLKERYSRMFGIDLLQRSRK